jgi:hypothetical protein
MIWDPIGTVAGSDSAHLLQTILTPCMDHSKVLQCRFHCNVWLGYRSWQQHSAQDRVIIFVFHIKMELTN